MYYVKIVIRMFTQIVLNLLMDILIWLKLKHFGIPDLAMKICLL